MRLEPLTGAANMKVLIADDTLYRRNRSKHVELHPEFPESCNDGISNQLI